MPGTGFVSIGDYIRSNRGTLDRERGELLGGVNSQIDAAKAGTDKVLAGAAPGADPTEATGYQDALSANKKALDAANSLGSQGGLADLLTQQHKVGQEGALFDANLLGGRIDSDAGKRAASLSDYLLNAKPATAPAKAPPVKPGGQQTPFPSPGGLGPAGVQRKLGNTDPLFDDEEPQPRRRPTYPGAL